MSICHICHRSRGIYFSECYKKLKEGKPVGIDLITTLEFTTSKMSDHDAPDQSHEGEQENCIFMRQRDRVCVYLPWYLHTCLSSEFCTPICRLFDSFSAEQMRGEGMHAWLASRTAIIHFTNELGNNTTTVHACSSVVRPALRALRPLSSNH